MDKNGGVFGKMKFQYLWNNCYNFVYFKHFDHFLTDFKRRQLSSQEVGKNLNLLIIPENNFFFLSNR